MLLFVSLASVKCNIAMSTTLLYLLMMPGLLVGLSASNNETLSDAETTSKTTLISVDNVDAYGRMIKSRGNVMADTASVRKVNLSLGLFFYAFIIIGLILDAVRISKGARRRSAAKIKAKLRKNQPLTKSQTQAYKHRKSLMSLFAQRSCESNVKKHLEVSTSPSSNKKSAVNLQDTLPSIPETNTHLEEVISVGKATKKKALH